MTHSPKQWAAHYAATGFAPIPLWTPEECQVGECAIARRSGSCYSPGKHPRVGWKDRRRVTPSDVDGWWSRWPQAGVALLTGRRSGFDVIDVDPKNGGDLEAVLALDGIDRPTVVTGSDGSHIYLRYPGIDTTNGLADVIGLPGVDYRGDGGLVVAPPSKHVSGGYYRFADGADLTALPPMPPWLVEAAEARAAAERKAQAEAAEVRRRLAENPPPQLDGRDATPFGAAVLEKAVAAIRAAEPGTPGTGRHDTTRARARTVGGYVATGEIDEGAARQALLAAAVAVAGESRTAEMEEVIDYGLEHGKRLPLEKPEPDLTPAKLVAPPATTIEGDGHGSLTELYAAANAYMHHADPTHFAVVAATAATAKLDGDPLWLLLVAPPSSGKTEAIRALDGVADVHLDDVTTAGLLTFTRGKNPKPTGALVRLPDRGLMTFGDLSTLLAGSDRGGREDTFAALRKVYDGNYTRTLATGQLVWEGRATVAGAVTGIIDRYSSHETALGDRWVYWRLPGKSHAELRKAQRAARQGDLDKHRQRLADAMRNLVVEARHRIGTVEVSDDLADALEDAALVAAFARAAVPRHGYGSRDIDGLPVIEEPHRITRQLTVLARGLLAVGFDQEATAAICRRAALSSMPEGRRRLLDVLAAGEALTTAEVARQASMNRKPARMRLEDMEAIGLTAAERDGRDPADDERDLRPAHWRLDGEMGRLAAAVIHADSRGWDEVLVTHTPPPP